MLDGESVTDSGPSKNNTYNELHNKNVDLTQLENTSHQ
jgi:hypothetical protein